MRKNTLLLCSFLWLFSSISLWAQTAAPKGATGDFWNNVHFGGGLGLGFGNSYTNILVAPSAIYKVNPYFSAGLGIQYAFNRQKYFYESHSYGGSLIGLVNPIPAIQFSAELEQLRVNNTYEGLYTQYEDNFWNTALFLGAGYSINNVTVGVRYNVLFKDSQNVYGEAWMPFVRAYF